MLYIVGLGPGSEEYILPKAVKTLEEADLIIGFKRAVDSINYVNTAKITVTSLKDTLKVIEENRKKAVALVASGDPCFYGITDFINKNYEGELSIIPGISSFQYLSAKLKLSWNSSFLGSLHGRKDELIKIVRQYESTIWLTDRENSPKFICRELLDNGLNSVRVHVGENLSYKDERITSGTPDELLKEEFGDLSVVVIENDFFEG